jgi:hypothetical protein
MWKRVTSVKKVDASMQDAAQKTGDVTHPSPTTADLEKTGAAQSSKQNVSMSKNTSEHLLKAVLYGYAGNGGEQQQQQNHPPAKLAREKKQLESWLSVLDSSTDPAWFNIGLRGNTSDQALNTLNRFQDEHWLDELAAAAPEPTWIRKVKTGESVRIQSNLPVNICLSVKSQWTTPEIDWTLDEHQV